MSFVHLHVHSEHSLLRGLPTIPELVQQAKNLGYTALALTDTDSMAGLILFYEACLTAGIKPILGATLTDPQHAAENLILLARDDIGYGDLCQILTWRHLNTDFSIRTIFKSKWPHLNLICGHLGLLQALAHGPNRERLHGELLRGDAEQRLHSRTVAAWCDSETLPVVATGGVHFLKQQDHALHRIVRAMALNSTLSRLRPGETAPAEAWFMPEAKIRDSFDDRPQAVDAANRLAEDCIAKPPLGQWIMPRIEVAEGHTPDTLLAEVAYQGLQKRYGSDPRLKEATELQTMELGVIAKLGFASYFLMVREMRQAAGGLFTPGYRRSSECTLLRGSAANSITFYNLEASDLDPLQHDLYFQRFLNEDRASPPDADLDFGWDERERILDWMVMRFGRDRVAITGTTNRFQYRSAFREVAKVMGYSEAQVTEVLDTREGVRHGPDDTTLRSITAIAARLQGKPHFLGQHPGGVLVTNEPIARHVACQKSGGQKDRIITQVDMHNGVDALGLIKFDLLGNGSLSVFRDTLEQLRLQGIPDPPEVHDVKACCQDPQVLAMMSQGRTRGIFYIESPAQIRLNQKCHAETFEEITITSSLVRPAGTAYTRTYVERHRKHKAGIVDWDFLHPSLAPILGASHDVCAFQEDVTRICHEVAGLTFKQADQVRKMMNSQHEGAPATEAMMALERAFKDGCCTSRSDGHAPLTPTQANTLWTRIASFTGFSFCKSHSASYAQLSFRCAWLKAHYPAAFLASVISNNHGFYRREVYIDEARRWGLRLLPIDINASQWKYCGEGQNLRPGFLHLQRFTEYSWNSIEAERQRNGLFRSFDDFLRRVAMGRKEMESLVLVGAFDSFGISQPELLYHLYGMPRHRGQDPAFAPDLWGGEYALPHTPLRKSGGMTQYNLLSRCLQEENLMGYMLSADPVDVLALHPLARGAVLAADISHHAGKRIRVVGRRVTDRNHEVAKSGRLMHFLTLADRTGMVDVLFWPDVFERCRDILGQSAAFEIWGKVSEDWGTFSLEAERLKPVAFLPNLIDFEKASQRLNTTQPSCQPYAELRLNHGNAQAA